MKNEIFLDFRILGIEDLHPDEITTILGITPRKIHIKGAIKNPNNPNATKVYESNAWMIDAGLGKYASFEEQMNHLLDIIERKINQFAPLCNKYHTVFACVLLIYMDNDESKPWVHLGKRFNELNKILNSEFDIDLYCLTSAT